MVPWRDPRRAFESLPEAYATATLKDDHPSMAASDCRSLYDLLSKTATPSGSEFRTQLHARAIKDVLQEGIQIRWVHTGAQVADTLRKVMSNQLLRPTLALGRYQLADEQELLKSQATNHNRAKWLHAGQTDQEHSKTAFRESESSLDRQCS